MRKIPGLNDLRVFEAAARLQNFRQAAEELHVTHGAVSHRVRDLEDQLSVSLFDRQNGVRLTESGRELYIAVDQALQILGSAVERIVQHHGLPGALVRLSVLPSFAARWLLPLLPDFYQRHPEIPLQIEASFALADLGPHGVDAAIRFGRGAWKGVQCHKLMDEYYYPVASPDFVRAHHPLQVEDLLRLPLIKHAGSLGRGATWTDFFAALHLPANAALRTTTFDDGNLVLRAAEQGMGIAFARHHLVARDIQEGRLQRLLDCGLRGEYAYYFVTPADAPPSTGVQALGQWLLAQAQRSVQDFTRELTAVRWLG